MNFTILLQGMGLGASLIIPIGAQNAYVLNQAIRRRHHLIIAFVCSLLDLFFIPLGIFGGGHFMSNHPMVLDILSVGGVLFLTFYAFMSLRSAFGQLEPLAMDVTDQQLNTSRRTAIFGALAVTLFNPHLYLDTVVILGSIGGQYSEHERLSFAVGSVLMSFIWFYGLSIGGAKLSSFLSKPMVRRWIDIIVAAMMLFIAAQLIRNLLTN